MGSEHGGTAADWCGRAARACGTAAPAPIRQPAPARQPAPTLQPAPTHSGGDAAAAPLAASAPGGGRSPVSAPPAAPVRTAGDAPLCLSLTRLTRRLGRGPLTGIDRVERAWLDRALAHGRPVFGLVRSATGYLLLDRPGLRQLAAWVDGAPPPAAAPAGLLSRLLAREDRPAERALALLALSRCSRPGLARMLRRHLPAGTHYLNVGHSDLRRGALAGWRGLPGARVAVLLHDTIPLDLPQSQRPGTVAGFRARMRAVAAHADLVIHVSASARATTEAWLAAFGRVPPGLVAHPGVTLAPPQPGAPTPGALPFGSFPAGSLPPDLPGAPYFVVLGTIEPRKNHALLLDVWERLATLGPAAPHLLVLGRRGWANQGVFARLDALRRPGTLVHELEGLDDGAVAALLLGARALLMPSRAEGYGLPVLEAAARGVPVLAADLPVYRETIGKMGVYLSPDDHYGWQKSILALARNRTGPQPAPGGWHGTGGQEWLPTWQRHFERVLDRVW